jgi:hypothetical protein
LKPAIEIAGLVVAGTIADALIEHLRGRHLIAATHSVGCIMTSKGSANIVQKASKKRNAAVAGLECQTPFPMGSVTQALIARPAGPDDKRSDRTLARGLVTSPFQCSSAPATHNQCNATCNFARSIAASLTATPIPGDTPAFHCTIAAAPE